MKHETSYKETQYEVLTRKKLGRPSSILIKVMIVFFKIRASPDILVTCPLFPSMIGFSK